MNFCIKPNVKKISAMLVACSVFMVPQHVFAQQQTCHISQKKISKSTVVLKDIKITGVKRGENALVSIHFDKNVTLEKIWGDAFSGQNSDKKSIAIKLKDDNETTTQVFGLKADSQSTVNKVSCRVVSTGKASNSVATKKQPPAAPKPKLITPKPSDDKNDVNVKQNTLLVTDQCNKTKECQVIFGTQANDCADSESSVSTCMCGDKSCSEKYNVSALVYAVNVGGKKYRDKKGIMYSSDFGYSKESKIKNTADIKFKNTADHALYQSQRWANELSYDFPVTNGHYNVTIMLAEHSFKNEGQRSFSLLVEDDTLATNIDLVAEVGANTATQYSANNVRVYDGNLTVNAESVINSASIAAILITSVDGKPTCDEKCIRNAQAKNAGSATKDIKPKQSNTKDAKTNVPTPKAPKPKNSKNTLLNVDFNSYTNSSFKNYTEANLTKDFGKPDKIAAQVRGFNVNARADSKALTKIANGRLRAHFPANKSSAKDTGFIFDKSFTPTEEATFEYDVKFESGFEWAAGGKLPGLGGTGKNNVPVGCNKSADVQKNGFSVRLMWRKNGDLVAYTYLPNRIKNGKIASKGQGSCGIDYKIANLKAGTQYTIKQYIKLNDANKSNGILKVEVLNTQGEVIDSLHMKNVKFRTNSKVKINNALYHTYRGGGRTDRRFMSNKSSYIEFDNFKITK